MIEQRSTQRSRVTARAVRAVVISFLFAGAVAPLAAQVASPQVQAETFARLFRFDRQLVDAPSVEVLFVHPDGDFERWRQTILDLARAFAGEQLNSRGIGASDLGGVLTNGMVAYFLPGAATPEAVRAVEAAGVLSVSASQTMAESGQVAIALGREERSGAEIFVNPAVLESLGHNLPAQVLKRARLVGDGSAASSTPVAAVPEYSVGDPGVRAPRLIGFERPPYPPLARRLGVEGTVELRVLVDGTGRVMEVEVVEGIPQDVGINEAAVDAGWAAQFEPGSKDGQPAQVWTTMSVPFEL